MKLRDKLWLWGQTPNLHHIYNLYGLPSVNRMTAREGSLYFGIPNVCRVEIGGWPEAPFEQEAMVLDNCKNVVWGVRPNDEAMLDAVIDVAADHKNIRAAILDDFFSDTKLSKQPPSAITELREKLHAAPNPLDLWSVIYNTELFENRIPYIAECDAITFWTIDAQYLPYVEKNYKKLRTLTGDKPVYCGMYMWDYHGKKHIPLSLMQYQLDFFYSLLKKGEIEGLILCSNCIGDVGLEAVSYTRRWIQEHGDEEI